MRFIFERFKQRFIGYIVADYLHDIPDDIKDPALKVMEEHGRKLEKLFLFMASQLHRRMLNDPKNSAHYQGMLVQLKILNAVIPKIPKLPSAAPKAPEKNLYDTALEGISAFTKGLSTPPASSDDQTT